MSLRQRRRIECSEQIQNHSSTTKIKKTIKSGETFIFQPVSSVEVWNEIDQLHRSKKTNGELSSDVVKSIADNCLEYIHII